MKDSKDFHDSISWHKIHEYGCTVFTSFSNSSKMASWLSKKRMGYVKIQDWHIFCKYLLDFLTLKYNPSKMPQSQRFWTLFFDCMNNINKLWVWIHLSNYDSNCVMYILMWAVQNFLYTTCRQHMVFPFITMYFSMKWLITDQNTKHL